MVAEPEYDFSGDRSSGGVYQVGMVCRLAAIVRYLTRAVAEAARWVVVIVRWAVIDLWATVPVGHPAASTVLNPATNVNPVRDAAIPSLRSQVLRNTKLLF